MADEIVLEMTDLRAVAAYAIECATEALAIFEQTCPLDSRPREAIETARQFAAGGPRVKGLRDAAFAALQAAQEAGDEAAAQAARAAMCAPAAAFLHPLARATQVRHILGAAAHAARAAELAAGDRRDIGARHLAQAAAKATPRVVEILRRYPPAPSGGGRVGERLRALDRALRDAES
jgi:hypothetical protein